MLDPQRVGLNAASVGFLVRTGQKVDWASFNQALQTDDSRVSDVRQTMETPVDELHVMGGQRFGLEGNSNLKMNARQERQINGYPLRSFSADAPAIILPDKYGGLPMYTRNQTEYSDFVSRYTAPLSTALQNDTVLLGRQGYSVTNESASHPYRDVGFEHNLHKSKDAIDYNEAAIKQRQWLQYQSQVARKQKQGGKITEMRMSSQNGRGIKNAVDGIFISANGEPMTHVNSDSLGDIAYDAEIHTAPPSESGNKFLPGTNQENPSPDETPQFLPAERASSAIASKVLSNRNIDPDMLPIYREQAARGMLRVWQNPLRQGFHQLSRNWIANWDKPRRYNTEGMMDEDRRSRRVSIEDRAAAIINRTVRRTFFRPNRSIINAEPMDMFVPLHAQATNGFVSVGQARPLVPAEDTSASERWGLSPPPVTPEARRTARQVNEIRRLSPTFAATPSAGESIIQRGKKTKIPYKKSPFKK